MRARMSSGKSNLRRSYDGKSGRWKKRCGFSGDYFRQRFHRRRDMKLRRRGGRRRVVGGDYYDVLRFDEDTLAFCIADVAGKGMAAALLMSNLQAAVRGLASRTISPNELCAQINRLMYQNIAADRFITFFYCVLDVPSGRLSYCNAGHPAPILLRGDGGDERLRDGGGVLGVFSSQEFAGREVQLRPGDRIVLFTDGVTEAHDAQGEEFGDAGVLRSLRAKGGRGAAAILTNIMASVDEFADGELEDDATLLVVAAGEN